jgi:transcriptional regulator with PAS, ATPase and Fis domain
MEPNPVELAGIRTHNAAVAETLERARRYAALEAPVLIEGETGTGKELLARALHTAGPRAQRPFVTIDCGALPEHLAESELFGHERGAFTSADRAYGGRIEAAQGGTLFFDEINSLSLPLQAKLLRFLETGRFHRLGRRDEVGVEVRIVSATNVPLDELVRSARMRTDFYYRVNVLQLALPPLRHRLEDIPLLVRQCVQDHGSAGGPVVDEVAPAVLAALKAYRWPGNVRELRHVIRRALALHAGGSTLSRVDLPELAVGPAPDAPSVGRPGLVPFRAWMREREREYLAMLLRTHATVAARITAAGLPERTFFRKLRALGLRPSTPGGGGGSEPACAAWSRRG